MGIIREAKKNGIATGLYKIKGRIKLDENATVFEDVVKFSQLLYVRVNARL